MARRRRPPPERPGWSQALLNAALGALALLLVVLLLGLLASTVLLGVGTLAPWIAAGLALFLFAQVVLFRWFGLSSAADRVAGSDSSEAPSPDDEEDGEPTPEQDGSEPAATADEAPSAEDDSADWRAWRG